MLPFSLPLPFGHAPLEVTLDRLWLCIGFAGQTLFFGRFFVQWLASEKEKKSVVPIAFWYFSLIGGAITLAYVIYRHDWPLIVGQATGLFIYTRNLMLIHGKAKPAHLSNTE